MENENDDYSNNLQVEVDEYFGNQSDFSLSDDDDDVDCDITKEDLILFENDENDDDGYSVDLSAIIDEEPIELVSTLSDNLHKLTLEEQNVINDCNDPTLKLSLISNRKNSIHCLEMLRQINKALTKLDVESRQSTTVQVFRDALLPTLWKFGQPYFKTATLYQPSHNVDFHRKNLNKELINPCFTEGRRWAQDDQVTLFTAISENYSSSKKNHLSKEINLLKHQISHFNVKLKLNKSELEEKSTKENLEHLNKLLHERETELNQLSNGKSYQQSVPFNSSEINWITISLINFLGKHSETECEAFWNIFLNPAINKKNWTDTENKSILELVPKYKYQDWDGIALELGTSRTGFMIIVHYYSKLCDKFKRYRFTPEEDKKILEVVDKCRQGSYIYWSQVQRYFNDRSRNQLYHRYMYYLLHQNVKKGTFSEAEDILILYLYNTFGKSYPKIANLFPNRTSVQIRNRYTNYLGQLNLNLGSFTSEDDTKLVKFAEKYGKRRWSEISRQLNRNRLHVRQRYMTIQKWKQKHPDAEELGKIPTKKQNYSTKTQIERNTTVRYVLEEVQKKVKGIPTLQTIDYYLRKYYRAKEMREKLPVTQPYMKKKESIADAKLIHFFKSTCKTGKLVISTEEMYINSANRIYKLLKLYQVDTKVIAEKINVSDESSNHLNDTLLHHVKDVCLSNDNNAMDISLPSTSCANRSEPKKPEAILKDILPPTITTAIGIRGFIIKGEEFKLLHRDYLTKIKKHILSDDIISKSIECTSLDVSIQQRKLFLSRLYSLLKWPSIISFEFPRKELLKPVVAKEEKKVDEVIKLPAYCKVGRPKKNLDKIKLMSEARKKKRAQSNVIVFDDEEQKLMLKQQSCSSKDDVEYYPKRNRPLGYHRVVKQEEDILSQIIVKRLDIEDGDIVMEQTIDLQETVNTSDFIAVSNRPSNENS